MSIREYARELVVHRRRELDRLEVVTFQAYQTVRIFFDAKAHKAMRPMSEYLITPKRQKTELEQRAVFEDIARQYGLTIRRPKEVHG